MDNRRYKNIVYNHLRESKPISLKMLLEDNENEESAGDKSPESTDFSMGEEPESGEVDSGESESLDKSAGVDGDEGSEDDADGEDEDDADGEDEDAIALASFGAIVNDINQIIDKRNPEDVNFGGIMANYTRELSSFVLSEADLEKPEEVIDDLETALNKSDGIIDRARIAKEKLKSGIKIDIDSEVSKAIDKLVHFREKVDIIDLIEDLFCNKIKLTAPAEDIDRNIDEFKEKYAEEVHKNRAKIDLPGSKHYNDESVYLDKHDGYNGAAGARSQG